MHSAAGSPSEQTTLTSKAGHIPWWTVLWFAVLLSASYAPVLYRLARQWLEDPDMGHGIFVPVVAGYIAWLKRHELMAEKPSPCWWGLLIVLYAAMQLYIAILGAELFLARTAFVISVAGTILFLAGKRCLRILIFPIFLLLFMIPIPAIIYNQLTFPLQLIASRFAETSLSLLNIPVLREGNVLELPNRNLNVVEACSGIRSLLSLSFLSLVYGYFMERRFWMRVFLLAVTAPIAIAANAARVAITGILSQYDPALAEGFFHTASGWVIFMIALGILVIFHRAVKWADRGFHGHS